MQDYAAQNDSDVLTRRIHEEQDTSTHIIRRDPYQRDRDRIVHSRAFRRMMHKTQVFNANKGDHYRNRLTHTLEVNQIARSIGKALELNDELIEAIALGHDLGHTPFGHIGERTLDDILMDDADNMLKQKIGENFKHNFQSLRVVDFLETRCTAYLGINLTLATREGILKHTKAMNKQGILYKYSGIDYAGMDLTKPSMTLEGQVVGIADEIAQCTHDLEDGIRSGVIGFKELLDQPLVDECIKAYNIHLDRDSTTSNPAYEVRASVIKNLVGYLIYDVCTASQAVIDAFWDALRDDEKASGRAFEKKQCVIFSPCIAAQVEGLKAWMNDKILSSEEVSISDAKSEYLIKHLFKAFYNHPLQLPDYMLEKYFKMKAHAKAFNRANIDVEALQRDKLFIRMVADHIDGMTDQYASRMYKKLYYPDYV